MIKYMLGRFKFDCHKQNDIKYVTVVTDAIISLWVVAIENKIINVFTIVRC